MRLILISFVVFLLAPAAGEAQLAIRPGQYEIRIDMKLDKSATPADIDADRKSFGEAGRAVLFVAGFHNGKRLECVTAEDAKKMLRGETGEEDCKTSDLRTAGNRVTFTLTCGENSDRTVVKTEMTVDVDSFTSVSVSSFEGNASTSRLTAQRVGECSK